RRKLPTSDSRLRHRQDGGFLSCHRDRCRFLVSAVIAGWWNSSGRVPERARTSSWRRAMSRVVSVFLPNFPTDRFRRALGGDTLPADQPLVLAGSDGRRRVVTAANETALRQGLRPGMPLAKAQVLVPSLRIENADPQGDAEALERLAFWALRYTPE